jgi:hypothetical protein
MKMEQASQATESDATDAKALNRRLDTKSFMEAPSQLELCFGELSGEEIASTALRKADY